MRRAHNFQDLTGRTFDRLAVIAEAPRRKDKCYWMCQCECGRRIEVATCNLTRGKSRSCGCLRREMYTKHGKSKTSEYHIWHTMNARCDGQERPQYKYYGERGVTVCERWRNSFEAFLEDMGPRPSAAHSIDRSDNDGNYEPGNCRWATAKEQANNRRRPRRKAA